MTKTMLDLFGSQDAADAVESLIILMDALQSASVGCSKHPEYRMLNEPKVDCQHCQWLYKTIKPIIEREKKNFKYLSKKMMEE